MMNEDEMLRLENQLCFPMYACSREITKAYYPLLTEIDLTYTQYLVMMVMWEYKQLSVKDICTKLYLDSGTLTPLLKKLEAKKMITRQRDPNDERSVIISLTDEGAQLKEKAKSVPKDMGCQVKISEEEYKVLHKLLYKIIGNIRNEK